MNELALFAGAGGGILGGVLLGWNCIGAVEVEKYPRNVLLARQRDGMLPPFPIWDDVRTFDGRPWRGLVDVVSGGFPCQDISCAGKGAGINGARSGLWREMHRIISEVRPRYAFMENSPNLTSRGLGRVLGDLAEIGYNAVWMCLSAADCGALHKRERIWIPQRTPNNVDFFHTPTCNGMDGGSNSRKALRRRIENLMPLQWPTPNASDWKRKTYKEEFLRKRIARGNAQTGIPEMVWAREFGWPTAGLKIFPTPTAQDSKLRANPAPNKTAQGSPCLTERILEQETSGGQLNPTWVEWLMGWPLEWTDLKPLETAKFLSWLQLHFSPSNNNLPN